MGHIFSIVPWNDFFYQLAVLQKPLETVVVVWIDDPIGGLRTIARPENNGEDT